MKKRSILAVAVGASIAAAASAQGLGVKPEPPVLEVAQVVSVYGAAEEAYAQIEVIRESAYAAIRAVNSLDENERAAFRQLALRSQVYAQNAERAAGAENIAVSGGRASLRQMVKTPVYEEGETFKSLFGFVAADALRERERRQEVFTARYAMSWGRMIGDEEGAWALKAKLEEVRVFGESVRKEAEEDGRWIAAAAGGGARREAVVRELARLNGETLQAAGVLANIKVIR